MVWAMCAALKLAAPRVLFTEVIKKQFLQVGGWAPRLMCQSHHDGKHPSALCVLSWKARPTPLQQKRDTCPRRRW